MLEANTPVKLDNTPANTPVIELNTPANTPVEGANTPVGFNLSPTEDVKPLYIEECPTSCKGELRSCRTNLVGVVLILIVCALGLAYTMSSCTISVNCVRTQGTAQDVLDEEQSPVNDVKPELTIPAAAL